jgi:hypothetical protein
VYARVLHRRTLEKLVHRCRRIAVILASIVDRPLAARSWLRRRGPWLSLLLAAGGAHMACSAPQVFPTAPPEPPRPQFRFEVTFSDVAAPCPDFWAGATYPPGTACGQAREASKAIYERPSGDEGDALRTLDRLCSDGIVEACDVGRELLWRCTGVDDSAVWKGACRMLAAAGRSFPADVDSNDWVERALPASLSGCHILQSQRTYGLDGNTYTEPNRDPGCVIEPDGCGDLDEATRVELDEAGPGPHVQHCNPEPLPLMKPGAIHCFEGDRWSFKRPGGPWQQVSVRWFELRGLETFGGGILRHGLVLSLEGTGPHPALRIGWTRGWLRRPNGPEAVRIQRERSAPPPAAH